jgi:hypothetical protein
MPDGSERWISARADVRRSRIFGVSYDVTERKHLEKRARELTEQLVRVQEEERQKISQNCMTPRAALRLEFASLLSGQGVVRAATARLGRLRGQPARGIEGATFIQLPHASTGFEQSSFGSALATTSMDSATHRDRGGLRVNQRVDKLPPRRSMLLRLVQEGLSNIYRHRERPMR